MRSVFPLAFVPMLVILFTIVVVFVFVVGGRERLFLPRTISHIPTRPAFPLLPNVFEIVSTIVLVFVLGARARAR